MVSGSSPEQTTVVVDEHNLIKINMAQTIVLPCTCKSEFQDKTYGKSKRLYNLRDRQKHKGEAICTVCGNKVTNAPEK